MRARITHSRDGHRAQTQQRRDQKQGKRLVVTAVEIQNQSHDERADGRAGLVQKFVQPERPAVADLAAGMRQQGVRGRFADGASGAFGHDQHRRQRPVAGQRRARERRAC